MSESDSPQKPADASDAKELLADQTPPAAPKRRHHGTKRGKGGVWRSLLILLVLAGVGVGGYFLWLTLQATRQQLSDDSAASRQEVASLDQRTERLERNIGEITGDISALQDQQQALGESIDKLRNETLGGAQDWAMEEIASLLQIANDRLILEGDIAPSLAALEAADRHLAALKNPALLGVRRLLAEEIAALRAVAYPDISGMALSLGAIIEGVEGLPVASGGTVQDTTTTPAAADQGWRRALSDIWEKLKGLVVIKRRGEGEHALLAPDERYFLKQNLRLNLEAARIALLRRDSRTYQQTLRSTQEWITQYFDNEAPATASTLQELARLQQIDLAPSLPDISGSLKALRARLTQQQRPSNKAMGAEAP